MILGIFAVLAFIPLLGVAWILLSGSLFTVDGLFMSLILLTISGVFGTTALFEVRAHRSSGRTAARTSPPGTTSTPTGNAARGRVQSVQFYEADVGQPNKSIVTLAGSGNGNQMLVFEGDLRNALPVGQKVKVTFRKQGGLNLLVDVTYS